MTDILIAAVAQDRAIVEQLAAGLRDVLPGTVALAASEDAARIDSTDLLLVVVGVNWAEQVAADPDLSAALSRGMTRSDLPVIVVRVDGAPMPPVTDLPEALRALAYMAQAPLKTGDAAPRSIARLARQIETTLQTSGDGADSGPGAKPTRRGRVPFNVMMLAAILAFALFIISVPGDDLRLPGFPGEDAEEDAQAAADAPPPAALYIGVGADLSGVRAGRGTEMVNAVRLALDDHPTLTVDNVPVTLDLLAQDTGCGAVGGARVAETFAAAPNVVGVVGHLCESSCAASLPIYDAASTVSISPGCTAADLTSTTGGSFYRVVPSQARLAEGAAVHLLAEVGDGVALLSDEQPLARALAPAFVAVYNARGGTLSGVYTGETGTLDPALQVDIALGNGATALVFIGRTSNAAAVAQALADADAELPLLLLIPDDPVAYIDAAGQAAEGTRFVTLAEPAGQAIESLRLRYIETYGSPPESLAFAYAYDAANLLLRAADAAAEAEDIRPDVGGIVVDGDAMARHLAGLVYTGVTGELRCDANGDCASTQTLVWAVQDGTLVRLAAQDAE